MCQCPSLFGRSRPVKSTRGGDGREEERREKRDRSQEEVRAIPVLIEAERASSRPQAPAFS